MNIIQAFDDDKLFAPQFHRGDWSRWRAFLKALFGLEMTAAELELFQGCTGRTAAPRKPFTEAALIVGRRGGKSRITSTIATFLATCRDYRPYLAAGEYATVMIIAASRSQARVCWRFCHGLLLETPALAGLVESVIENEQIVLRNRVVIEVGTASFRVTRGYSLAAVICDEIAFWRTEIDSATPDVEILRALRPGMATIPGSLLLLASSPYAKKGALFDAWNKHFGRDEARVLVWQAATDVMNPTIDPEFVAGAYEDDPEAASAELGAIFRSDLADFVSPEAVNACTAWGRFELPPMADTTYKAFLDPSGGSQDAFTAAVAHLEGAIGVLDAVLEIPAPFDPAEASRSVADLLKRYHVTRATSDRYAGEWVPTELARHGIQLEQSAKPKSDLYRDLLPLLNARRVELLDHKRLRAQMLGLERRTARGGRDSIDHGPGRHDDIVNSVAGVLTSVDLDRRPKLFDISKLPVVPERIMPSAPMADPDLDEWGIS